MCMGAQSEYLKVHFNKDNFWTTFAAISLGQKRHLVCPSNAGFPQKTCWLLKSGKCSQTKGSTWNARIVRTSITRRRAHDLSELLNWFRVQGNAPKAMKGRHRKQLVTHLMRHWALRTYFAAQHRLHQSPAGLFPLRSCAL